MSKWIHRFSPGRKPVMWIPIIFGGIVIAVAVAFLFGFFVMLLWNWLMPDIFGLKTITYWQAWGLVLLAHILFKIGHHNDHNRHHDHSDQWKDKVRRRFKPKQEEEDAERSNDKSSENMSEPEQPE